MALFLDSASPDDVRAAVDLGLVTSVTTNPALVAAATPGRGEPLELLRALCALAPGEVFYQLTAPTLDGRFEEAERALAVGPGPGRVGLKVPATTENMALVARFRAVPVAVTAIFGAGQCVAACAAGARYVIPYVNRTTRLTGDGVGWVRKLRAVTDAMGGRTEVLAASLKSPDEAVEALLAGAHHLTLPLAVLRALGEHPLSARTIAEFAAASAPRG